MLITCLYIFLARIVDVTLGTVRTVLIVKDRKTPAGIIAFFEVLIWFLVAREALNTNITSFLIPIFYAGGYATGTILGAYISSNFLNGLIGVQVIMKKSKLNGMLKEIRDKGFGVSIVDLKDNYEGEKKAMLFITLNKKSLKNLSNIIRSIDSDAFVVINETKLAQNGLIK